MAAPDAILKLIELFDRNRDAYVSGAYKEAQLRHEFVDPFFKALGWDVYNESGYAEAYKDVIYEDAIKVGGFTKAPDYCFRIGGTRKFFVEAKKPSVDIKDEPSPAFQLRRYAWSAKLPLSILTDFEEFAVYDCRVKPVKIDKAGTARILYMTDTDYEKQWDQISSVFSREAVLQGSFDKYAEETRGKKGTAEVDDAFLKEIESCRDLIARNIALRNPALTQRELNFAVQQTIDRIIFLRICEDRGIEEYGRLMALLNGDHVYGRLFELFQRADERYNSGLFHFRREKGRNEPADELTPALAVDDKPLKEIVKNLYYPDSAYEFSVLPADILGQVYEQFLGKVIRLTPGHRAVVEDKPEVKKAGGVYYTPTYIVDYIVKNTVGKLLEDKTSKQAAKLRILDPACGSGSFLIGAYQYLLDWHRDWYAADGPRKHTKELYQGAGGDWRLTTAERKRILLNNIYGVDIDPQAVEVTKLSLLLKVLEGESDETLSKQLQLFHERALPDLSDNIKCGNSLIGPDFYDNQQMSLLDEEERYRINAFDWNVEFPEIMKTGGFDVLIGNPPYGAYFSKQLLDYFRTNYQTAQGELESYILFIERSVKLLRSNGSYCMILPDTWLTLINAKRLRKWMLDNTTIIEISALNETVFRNATIDPLIIILQNKPPKEGHIVDVRLAPKKKRIDNLDYIESETKHQQKQWNDGSSYQLKIYASDDLLSILNKINKNSVNLGSFVEYRAGCKPYEVGKGTPPQSKNTVATKPFTADRRIGPEWKVLIRGNDVQRYAVTRKKPEYVKYGRWLAAPRDYRIYHGPRILIQAIRNPALSSRIIAAYTDRELICRINVYTLIKKENVQVHYLYLLGLINSRLLNWYLMKDYGLHTYVITGVLQLPIYKVDFSNTVDKANHDRIVKLVERMLELNKRLIEANTPETKNAIRRQINTTDHQIDKLLYKLYDLTDKEISAVEGPISLQKYSDVNASST